MHKDTKRNTHVNSHNSNTWQLTLRPNSFQTDLNINAFLCMQSVLLSTLLLASVSWRSSSTISTFIHRCVLSRTSILALNCSMYVFMWWCSECEWVQIMKLERDSWGRKRLYGREDMIRTRIIWNWGKEWGWKVTSKEGSGRWRQCRHVGVARRKQPKLSTMKIL